MAHPAYGNFILSVGDGMSPEMFTPIAGIKSFDGPNTTLSFQETTDFDSTGGFREYVGTLKDPGQMQLTLNFDPADFDSLVDLHDGAEVANFQAQYLTGADERLYAFSAYVESVGVTGQVDGLLEGKATLRVTGAIDRDAAAS